MKGEHYSITIPILQLTKLSFRENEITCSGLKQLVSGSIWDSTIDSSNPVLCAFLTMEWICPSEERS